jgi:hypothetical protein
MEFSYTSKTWTNGVWVWVKLYCVPQTASCGVSNLETKTILGWWKITSWIMLLQVAAGGRGMPVFKTSCSPNDETNPLTSSSHHTRHSRSQISRSCLSAIQTWAWELSPRITIRRNEHKNKTVSEKFVKWHDK